LPLLVGLGFSVFSVLLWQGLRANEQAYVERTTRQAARDIAAAVQERAETRFGRLARMAKRWEGWEGLEPIPRDSWEFDAELTLEPSSLKAIELVDPTGRVLWVVPKEGSPTEAGRELGKEESERLALEAAANRRQAAAGSVYELPDGSKGFRLFFPSFRGAKLENYLAGVVSLPGLLETVLENTGQDFHVKAYAGDELVYTGGREEPGGRSEWAQRAQADLHDLQLQIEVWPSQAMLAQAQSPLPWVTLVMGLLLSWLLALAAWLAQHAQGRAVALGEEIEVRQKTEEALRRSEAGLEESQRVAHLGSWEWDPGTEQLQWSEETYRIFRVSPETFDPSPEKALGFVHPDDREQTRRTVKATLEHGGRLLIEARLALADGMARVVRAEGEVHRNAARRIVRIVGTVQDITEQAHLEEQFRQAQKMEAVGRLAGGVAHDFNNLLMLIKGYSELLAERGRADETVRRYAVEIDGAADRATALTRQLLAFSRRQVLEPRVLDLNEVVKDVQRMLVRLIGEDIELVTRLEPAGRVRVDPGQLEQVILNLAVNARDAMPRGGRLTIETTDVVLDDGYARQHNGVQPGAYVMLAMSDTGAGMSEEVRAHIFEPFYTTKEKGKGTGLGLATVYGIVRQSGGNIWVYSELGRGTIFKMYFPRVEAPAESLRGRSTLGDFPRGTETVLLAEDAEQVRALAREFLEGLGYRVLEATDVHHAIEFAEKHQGPIDVLVTDLVMPQMGGRELAQRLAALRPAIRVLYMSGYTDEMIIGGEGLGPGVAFLQKPFTREVLARRMRELLDAPAYRADSAHGATRRG